MPQNNIIKLTPFRADLSRAMIRRGEHLMASTDLVNDVAALEPLEAYYIVREIGLKQALPILRQLSEEQLEACVDLDCWNHYDFTPANLDEWLAAFALAGPESLAKSFFTLDYVIQLLFLAQTVTVYDPDTDQVPPEVEGKIRDRAMTPDGFYLLELKDENELKIHPFTLLDAMYQFDSTATHRLLSEVRVELPMQISEEALRFRNGRMEDIGFVPPEEAAVLFSRPSIKPLPRYHEALDDTPTRLPAVYAESFTDSTLLQRALALIIDRDFLACLEQEVVWVINSAVIAYGEKTQDIGQITDIAKRVQDTVSLGMESLLTQDNPDFKLDSPEAALKASKLLDTWCIADLFRHGFAATLVLQKEAQQYLREPQFGDWYNLPETEQSDEPADRQNRAFVTALLGRHPLCGGFDLTNAYAVKAFACLADIDVARVRLQQLVGRICRQS